MDVPKPLDNNNDKKHKRRGRKPKDKFNYEDTTVDKEADTLSVDNNLIVKLPISCMELDREFQLGDTFVYNPTIKDPEPYDNIEECNYQNIEQGQVVYKQSQEHIDYYQSKINDLLSDLDEKNSKKQLTQIEILLNKKYKQTKHIDLMHSICMACDGNKWLANTNIACFWCCHAFDHTPWGIPTKYNAQSGVFQLSGIYCSPNCALSYLLEYEHNNMLLWEKVSLLNMLHYKIYMTDDNLVPAPDKICLKMFGGPLAIDEFRALTLKNNKNYFVNFPPCNIVSPVLEETKKIFNQDSYFVPIDKKRITRIQTELKIKRTHNVNKAKNTLDNVIRSQQPVSAGALF